jgi:chromosome segregation ATPase
VKQNLTENELKIQNQLEKIRELGNIIQEFTTKNKHQEDKIALLEKTSIEVSDNHKKEIQLMEQRIREISAQFGEQQNAVHQLKTENNSMKITINQLNQTVEGQKSAYENLRTQLANVYKEQQLEQANQQNVEGYIPKASVDINSHYRNSSFTRNKQKVYEAPPIGHGVVNEMR